jgi:Tn3 transposase DDE domain
LRQRYREGQEDQLGALGLVLNALILWNTRYMDAALSHLRAGSREIKAEDVARLSPLGSDHFNVLGRYDFHVTEEVLKGQLRPLRSPEDVAEYEGVIAPGFSRPGESVDGRDLEPAASLFSTA